ncbi:SusD/RagB family nutrient-binding outer membrane lipoprotein [Rubrivirga sp. S365]|uniref:SusD/RagB family nutrient-binding outer membrane lipoprotein n=1 Tax=Rubrivirga litoralis TaxID=3075598 RepID=A0ABU3BU96_9BACT|nr:MULTISPECIES: SusD/RagB family nutrient-binding outer membrane lipoprotein [unclassified Rubrivirga]MDT0632810.1 SusD/RagB family nutrient-binding outer membrane lipoprotein [Rubrivirga sp. F394]MDT7857501.1 SusD/RagB family nutrient-binding outer membrane lipoprotein [Rubrivirga sp. S365]
MTARLRPALSVLLAGAFFVAAPGCDGFLDINENPNEPTQVPVGALLASTTFATGETTFGLGNLTANYVQYLASPNRASASDVYERISLDETWGNLYDVMADLKRLEAQAAAEGATDYAGVARILLAYHLASTVDAWGSAPYSQAFDPVETLNPAYDDGEALYNEVFRLLADGIAALEAGGSTLSPGGDDFVYGGDTDLWVKTAYALRARYLNHLTKTDAYDPQAVLAAVDRAYTSEAESATVAYFDDEINPWADVAIDNANLFLGGWLSEQFVQAVDGTTYGVVDPRIEAYTDSLADGSYVGTVNGAGRGGAKEQGERVVLTTNTYYARRTAPLELVTYSEVKLVEAEAALRAGQRDRAYAAYTEAIRAHMDKLGVGADAAAAYLAAPQVSVGAAALTLDDVFREKYKVLFLNPEAWVDARRHDYDYEGFVLPANAELPEFIRRIDYPDTEYSRNASNIPEASLTDRIWWDQ